MQTDKISQQPENCENRNDRYNDVFFIDDIVSEDKLFLSHQEFQNKYIICTNFL
jgi:hypothetical protein